MRCHTTTFVLAILGALIQDEDLSLTLSQLVETKRGIITVASEALALLGMTPFIYIEICTVLEYGPKRWLSIWNLMDLATYFLQVCFISIRFDLIRFIQFDSMQFDMFTVLGGHLELHGLGNILPPGAHHYQSINQSIYISCLWDSSEESTSNK